MKEFTVLTINPGSSSTKMGVVKGDKVIVNREVDHHKEDFAECKTFADQEPIRMAMIRKALEEEGIALSDLDAVSGRGVGLYPCAGGKNMKIAIISSCIWVVVPALLHTKKEK